MVVTTLAQFCLPLPDEFDVSMDEVNRQFRTKVLIRLNVAEDINLRN